jgi:hypothetical protein
LDQKSAEPVLTSLRSSPRHGSRSRPLSETPFRFLPGPQQTPTVGRLYFDPFSRDISFLSHFLSADTATATDRAGDGLCLFVLTIAYATFQPFFKMITFTTCCSVHVHSAMLSTSSQHFAPPLVKVMVKVPSDEWHHMVVMSTVMGCTR